MFSHIIHTKILDKYNILCWDQSRNYTGLSTFSHSLPFFSVAVHSSSSSSSSRAQVSATWICCDGFFGPMKQILVDKHYRTTHARQKEYTVFG